MDWNVLARYFVHGIAFSFLFLILAFILGFLLAFLVIVGSLIGLIIGLGIILLAMGWLNCLLSEFIWEEYAKTSFWNLLIHGAVLFLILLPINGVLVTLPNLVLPSIITQALTFIVGSFAGGYVGRKVAEMFRETYRKERISEATKAKWADTKL